MNLLTDILYPARASTFAPDVDALYTFLLLVTAFFSLLIFLLILYFMIRYRRRAETERPRAVHGNLKLELVWSAIPFVIVMVSFAWGANIYFTMKSPPVGAREIFVLGKQWMWVIQHPEGKRELNQLHLPVGQPVKLTMISEDVIHDFYIPAFRAKADVLPGRYSTLWFEPTLEGSYHLFCAEYCGTDHSKMVGQVVVMSPVDFEDWLSGGESSMTLAERGEKLFSRLGCLSCHGDQPTARGPSLAGLAGSQVQMTDGTRVLADDAYLRESILEPAADIVAGYEPIMPTYKGQVTEEQLLQLVSYIKTLSATTARTGN